MLDGIVGSIYWPIIERLKIVRSETIPSPTTIEPLNIFRSATIPFPPSDLFANSTEVYCPHITESSCCMLTENEKCHYTGNNGSMCTYDTYHELFLLLNKNAHNGNGPSIKWFSEDIVHDSENLRDLYLSSNCIHFPTTLNAFPQTQTPKSELKGWGVYDVGIEDKVFFATPESYT